MAGDRQAMNGEEGQPLAVTRAEYARLAGISRARVTQLGDEDLLAFTGDGLVDVAATDKLRSAVLDPMRGGDRTGKQASLPSPIGEAGSLLAARLREVHVRLARVHRRGAEMAAASVSGWQAKDELRSATDDALERLRRWPAATAPKLVAITENSEVHRVITDSIEILCNAIADEADRLAGDPQCLVEPARDIPLPDEISKEAYKQAQAREADARAQVGALEEYLETGILKPADVVEAHARDKGVTAREALLAVPDRTAGPVAASTDAGAIEQLLTKEIEIVCSELMRSANRER